LSFLFFNVSDKVVKPNQQVAQQPVELQIQRGTSNWVEK